MRVAMRASTRLVSPGSAFGSNTTIGNPRSTAASIIGPAAYPPTPSAATNRCLLRIENESHIAGTSFAVLRASFIPPMPLSPAERIVSSGNPASGTRRASIPRCVPTNTTSLSPSRDIHSRATARAGNTWPPVPPPAINSFNLRCPESSRSQAFRGAGVPPAILHYVATGKTAGGTPAPQNDLIRLPANIQQNAGGQQHHQQAR